MGRKEKRAAKALEKNPIKECNKIQKKYVPGLMKDYAIYSVLQKYLWDSKYAGYDRYL